MRAASSYPALVLALLPLAACRPTPAYQGSTQQILATYRYRTLSSDLPPETRIPSIAAAGRATLLERGYSIQSESTTEEHAELSAVRPDPDFLETMEIEVVAADSGPRIRITVEPLGDQPKSRAVLEGILAKLGR